jgi:hypothetical protein
MKYLIFLSFFSCTVVKKCPDRWVVGWVVKDMPFKTDAIYRLNIDSTGVYKIIGTDTTLLKLVRIKNIPLGS